MFYLGIDIAKNTHVASLIDEKGKNIFKGFSFSNTTEGGKSLLEIVKVSGMRGMMSGLSMGNSGAQAQLGAQLSAINNYRNINDLVLIDKDDEYDRKERQLNGLNDLLQNVDKIALSLLQKRLIWHF